MMRLAAIARKYLPDKAASKLGRLYRRLSNLLKYGDWHFPHAFYIEISELCNRSCSYCPNWRGKRHGSMTEETFEAACRKLRDINWTGTVGFHAANEPLLDKRLPDFLARLKQLVPRCLPMLVTNGDALTMEKAEMLFAAGMARISVSRHAPFSDAWDAKISTIRKRWPGRVMLTQVGVTIAQHGNASHGTVGIPWQGKCIAPTLASVIDINGNMTLCCCDYDRQFTFGNVNKDSIRSAWLNKEYSTIRSALRQGKQATKLCEGCSGVI